MKLAILAALAFVATVFGANYALATFGLVPVGFGLMAPAGVFFAGLAFLLRDVTQRLGGKGLVAASILVGAAASYSIEPTFAIASGVAFLVSELADFGVYTPLEERGFIKAAVASNVVGAVVDSALFLWLAFGSLAFMEGQVVGKLWVTLAALPFVMGARRALEAGRA